MTETSSTGTAASTPTELDLAFIIDATGTMGCYIQLAQDVSSCLYGTVKLFMKNLFRTPQENTFVIQFNDFTNDANKIKANIQLAFASGGLIS